jgi:peptide deformylase
LSTNKPKAVQVGDPIIRSRLIDVVLSELSTLEIRECIERMRLVNDAMQGVGISANQVGYSYRISLIHVKKTKNRPYNHESVERIMVNPKIIATPPAQEYMWEGCLSVAEAGLFCKVKRYKRVKIEYYDLSGDRVETMLDGLEAHIAQHELGHLDGRIFLDEEIDPSSFMSAVEYRKMRKQQRSKKL